MAWTAASTPSRCGSTRSETKTDGLAILLASAFGHLSHEVSGLNARVDALELDPGLSAGLQTAPCRSPISSPIFAPPCRACAARSRPMRRWRRSRGFAPAGRRSSCSRPPTRPISRPFFAGLPQRNAVARHRARLESACARRRRRRRGHPARQRVRRDRRRRPDGHAPGQGRPTSRWRGRRPRPGSPGCHSCAAFPAPIGGALRMNGGAYGGETKDVFVSARGVRRDGSLVELSPADMGFAYRKCGAPADIVFTEATSSRATAATRRRSLPRCRRSPTRGRPRSRSTRAPAARPSRIRPAIRPGSWSTRPAAGACASAMPRSRRCTPIFSSISARRRRPISRPRRDRPCPRPGQHRRRARMGDPPRRCARLTRLWRPSAVMQGCNVRNG